MVPRRTMVRRPWPRLAGSTYASEMAELSSPSGDSEIARLATDLRVAEYKSVRDEWLASRDAQQHTLQWTLAALAVLFAGILSSKIRQHHPELYVGLAFAAGLIAISSYAIWFGEVMRMERAALFLRGLEVVVSKLTQGHGKVPPLSWETWRGSRPMKDGDPWMKPAAVLILACFCLYLVLTAAAFLILIVAAGEADIPGKYQHVAGAAAVAVGLLYLIAVGYTGRVALKTFGWKGSAPDLALPHRDSPEVHSGR